MENLLSPEASDELTAILTYHVVPGKVMASQVSELTEARTVNGQMLNIRRAGATVKVNEATIIESDLQASNGVIHVVDAVVMPPLM